MVRSKQQWSRTAHTLAFLLARSNAFAAQQSNDQPFRQQQFQRALAWSDVADVWSSRKSLPIVNLQRRRIELAAAGTAVADSEAGQAAAKLAAAGEPAADDSMGHLLAGIEYYERQDLAKAAASFRMATQLAPHDPAGWLRLADVMMRQGEYERALAYFDVCTTLLPDSEFVCFQRGLCWLQHGQPPQAIADFTRSIDLKPDLQVGYLNRALAQIAAGQPQAALQDLNHVIEQETTCPRAYFIRSRLLKRLGNAAAAAQDVEQGLAAVPRDDLGWIARGIARISTQPKQALSDFEQALKINPASGEALNNIAHVYSEILNESDKAIGTLTRSLEIDQADTLARAGRGVLLARAGRFPEAIADARALRKHNLDAITRYQEACIYALASRSNPDLTSLAIGTLMDSLLDSPQLLNLTTDDPDLNNIRDDEEFLRGIAAVKTIRDLMNANGGAMHE